MHYGITNLKYPLIPNQKSLYRYSESCGVCKLHYMPCKLRTKKAFSHEMAFLRSITVKNKKL